MDKKNIKSVIIVVALLSLFTIAYLILSNMESEQEYETFLKNYKVNEFIPVYVSDESMARIYLNDFINTMFNDPEKAYYLLDEDYRTKKFPNISDYYSYVDSQRENSYVLKKYYKENVSGYVVFCVYDNNDNIFLFKTKGVMQYSVYLDDYTVEIG